MKNFFIAIGTALLLAIWAGMVCGVLGFVYMEIFGFPIEALAIIAFFFYEVAPTVLILGVVYSIVAQRLRCTESGALYRLRAFLIAAASVFVIIAIIFPCDAEPYFIGGFVLRLLFGGV